ncbi:unnamed protein product [Rotaria sp. Silwood2]|nr:unnamed protein product [Rotaria sp. Silwood2]CAF4228912.1 unnamed protein product [Rotaria sp. Silwood2]CAF4345517.1 unnamed protein product [Rotaria sp. Silwood2]CAF4470720.1 unnamed protein product [Rotaria sp. Silwood2]
MSDIIQSDYKEHWQEIEIILERLTSDDKSLGFTVAGGTHVPFLPRHRRLASIVIVNIIENSLAHRDKRLKLYDIILRVNNIDFTNIKYETAVHILRKAGPTVKLLIRRLSPSIGNEIILEHRGKLGITIRGGIGNECFPNDHGIFIADIRKYHGNQQLYRGDRLLQISTMRNTYDVQFVTHKMAEQIIKLARKESKTITLYVGHAKPSVGISTTTTTTTTAVKYLEPSHKAIVDGEKLNNLDEQRHFEVWDVSVLDLK